MTIDPVGDARVAVLHGAGYAAGELVRLLLSHPGVSLDVVTSRSFAGRPLWHAHPALRGVTDLEFAAPDADVGDLAAVFLCAEHGRGAEVAVELRAGGFSGLIVDLSADHRLEDEAEYARVYGREHPAPDNLATAVYGLPEVNSEALAGATLVANPGCFATGMALALWPLAGRLDSLEAHVTALTGASGSGAQPSSTTHFPTRDGNVRAYSPLVHRHVAEVTPLLGPRTRVHFVPVSGPWTRGIWGTAHVALPDGVSGTDVASWYQAAYPSCPMVRLWPGTHPEMLPVVGTPFCDIGWVESGGHLVVCFALDNLLKGAAAQAVQNMNLALGMEEAAGLLPAAHRIPQHA